MFEAFALMALLNTDPRCEAAEEHPVTYMIPAFEALSEALTLPMKNARLWIVDDQMAMEFKLPGVFTGGQSKIYSLRGDLRTLESGASHLIGEGAIARCVVDPMITECRVDFEPRALQEQLVIPTEPDPRYPPELIKHAIEALEHQPVGVIMFCH